MRPSIVATAPGSTAARPPRSGARVASRASSQILSKRMSTDIIAEAAYCRGFPVMTSDAAMIEYQTGDILQADVEALVNAVNCVGVMGRGLALEFKKAYPKNFRVYEAACAREEVQPGRMFVFDTGRPTNPKFIINFPTKRHWRGSSRIEDIESGLQALAEEIRARHITSIALPALGSGLGGLDWRDVRPRIEKALGSLPGVHVILFEPRKEPE